MSNDLPELVRTLSDPYQQLYRAVRRRPHRGWLELPFSFAPLKQPLDPLVAHVDVLRDSASASDRAQRAYPHAKEMFPNEPVFGVGLAETARGLALASHDPLGTFTETFTFTQTFSDLATRTPLQTMLVLRTLASACGITPRPPVEDDVEVGETVDPAAALSSVREGEADYLLASETGDIRSGDRRSDLLVFSGSFHPLHRGHRHLAEVAETLSDKPLHFEIPLVNADKAPLDLAEARRRVQQFARYRPVLLTKAPLFTDKARRFPGSTFVVGADTADRLVNPRFYDDDAAKMRQALDELTSLECDFLVAGRDVDGKFTTLDDLAIPKNYAGVFRAIPEARFRHDVSSTQIRQGRAFGEPDGNV